MTAPDLVAESRVREQHGAHLAGKLPVWAGTPVRPGLRGLDPYVFGDWSPRTDPASHSGLYRTCARHPGIGWYGASGCWVCEPNAVREFAGPPLEADGE